jgi:hypothetical protein
MGESARAEQSIYEFRLRGHLDQSWSESFPGFALTHSTDPDGSPVTIMRGPVVDEAGLHGHLTRIRDLGIPLLLVRREEPAAEETEARAPEPAADAQASSSQKEPHE